MYRPIMIRLALLCLAVLPLVGAAVATAEDDADRFVAVRAGLIYPVEGDPIEHGVIVIRNGRIDAVGKNVEYPRSATVIDADDLVVMPGLINPCTSQGLRPFGRNGLNADLKAVDEFVLDEEIYHDLLQWGFTTFGLAPVGTGFPGQASAFKPIGAGRGAWTLNDAAYLLCTMTQPSKQKVAFKNAFQAAQKEIEKVEAARKEWEEKQKKKAEQAKADKAKEGAEEKKDEKQKEEKKNEEQGGKGENSGGNNGIGSNVGGTGNIDHNTDGTAREPKEEDKEKDKDKDKNKDGEKGEKDTAKEKEDVFKPPPINPKYQPLVDLIQKAEKRRALITLDQASDYRHFQEALGDFEIERSYWMQNGAGMQARLLSSDLERVAVDIGKEGACVVLKPVLNFKPNTTNRVNLAAVFASHGCEIAFIPAADNLFEHGRFLNRVGQSVKAGLCFEEALKAVTLHPARVLGMGDRLGSLVPGKDGNLLFLTGDPFDTLTRVEKVMIQGEIVAQGHAIQ